MSRRISQTSARASPSNAPDGTRRPERAVSPIPTTAGALQLVGEQRTVVIPRRDEQTRIRAIRARIGDKSYLTQDKIEFVVDCLCDVLRRGRGPRRRASA